MTDVPGGSKAMGAMSGISVNGKTFSIRGLTPTTVTSARRRSEAIKAS